jgi:hypothetical protein
MQRELATEDAHPSINTQEMIMELEIVQLGTASIETREPIFPPVDFDGLSFQFFQPFW